MFLPNIDSLFFSINILDYNIAAKELLELLEINQELAKKIKSNINIMVGNQTFNLLPNGARNYKYILHNNRYEIRLQQFYSFNSTNFPIYIRLKSEYLWELRDQAYFNCIEFIESNLSKVIDVKMSRADLCCHTDKIDMSKLKLKRFVTRSTYKELHMEDIKSSSKKELYYTGTKLTGLSLGKNPIRCRIYDKSLEILQSSKKTWFYQIWKEYGVVDETVVNVEFQLNRQFFKTYKIETYEDFNNEILTIWRYLTENWLRYVNSDHSRIEDCTTNSVWHNLQHAYDKDWRSFNGIARYKQKSSNAESLKNMIRHYMVNHAAVLEIVDFDKYSNKIIFDVDKLLNNKGLDFTEEVNKKMLMG